MIMADALQTLLDELDYCLISREVPRGFQLLDQILEESAEDFPSALDTVPFCLHLAQWVDLGYRDVHFLRIHVEVLPQRRLEMSVEEHVQLDLLHGYLALA